MGVWGGTQTHGSGSGSWTVPFACTKIRAIAIGSGASGYKDCDGDDQGGGGGGGGIAIGEIAVVGGNTINWKAGSGGNSPSCDNCNRGENSYVRVSGGSNIAEATGGQCGTDDNGGGGGGSGTGNIKNENGQRGADDDAGQDGGSAGNCGGCGNGNGGKGSDPSVGLGSVTESCSGCPGGRGGANRGGGGAGNDGGDAGSGGNGYVGWTWFLTEPSISCSGSTNNNSDGVPDSNVTITWSQTYASSIEIRNGGTVVASLGANNSPYTFSSGLQSSYPSNSPATRTYTVRAIGPGGNTDCSATVQVYNDNTPSNSWTTSFTGLESKQTYVKLLGTLDGTDMPVKSSTSGTNNFLATNLAGAGAAKEKTYTRGNGVYLQFESMPFNTNVSGETGEFGKTNSKTISVTVGTQTFNVTVQTRAPRIREPDLDLNGDTDNVPYPDIDVIPGSPDQYVESGTQVLNDIELLSSDNAIELKMNKPDAQTRIKRSGSSSFGSWQNVRSI